MKINYKDLAEQTLKNVLIEIISREATDYGLKEKTLDEKIQELLLKLTNKEVSLVWDTETNSISIEKI